MTILERFRVDGRVAIVTGASSGIGVDFAVALAEAGADVALAARREDRLTGTRKLVENTGRGALVVRTDVTSPDECRELVDATMRMFGRVASRAGLSARWPQRTASSSAPTRMLWIWRTVDGASPSLRDNDR